MARHLGGSSSLWCLLDKTIECFLHVKKYFINLSEVQAIYSPEHPYCSCPSICVTCSLKGLWWHGSAYSQPYGVAFPDEGASQFEIGKNEYLQHDPFLEASKTKLFTGTRDRDFAKMVILGIVILFVSKTIFVWNTLSGYLYILCTFNSGRKGISS